jgi:ABC-type lipoprotein release transport system permease subunit
LLGNLLYGVGQGDALLFGGVAVVIVAAVVLACWLPTRRALRVAPMEALRCE